MSENNRPIHELYVQLKNLDPDRYLQLISETEDKEEIEFIIKVMDIILQQRQRESINSSNS